MRKKPRIINLSDIKGEFRIQEPSRDILRVIINSNTAHSYAEIIRARSNIELRGVGNRYDGIYYVENVSHSTGKGEYKMSFTLKINKLLK